MEPERTAVVHASVCQSNTCRKKQALRKTSSVDFLASTHTCRKSNQLPRRMISWLLGYDEPASPHSSYGWPGWRPLPADQFGGLHAGLFRLSGDLQLIPPNKRGCRENREACAFAAISREIPITTGSGPGMAVYVHVVTCLHW